jgi:hypothetical protein
MERGLVEVPLVVAALPLTWRKRRYIILLKTLSLFLFLQKHADWLPWNQPEHDDDEHNDDDDVCLATVLFFIYTGVCTVPMVRQSTVREFG